MLMMRSICGKLLTRRPAAAHDAQPLRDQVYADAS